MEKRRQTGKMPLQFQTVKVEEGEMFRDEMSLGSGLTLEDITVSEIKDHTLIITITNQKTGGKRRKQFLLPIVADITALTYELTPDGIFKIQAPFKPEPESRRTKKSLGILA